MKSISIFFTSLLLTSVPAVNAIAQDVVNDTLSKSVAIEKVYYDPAPVPGFPGGLYQFQATFTNVSEE